jgi:hypothetical protein
VSASPPEILTQPVVRRRHPWRYAAAAAIAVAAAIFVWLRAGAVHVTSIAVLPVTSTNDEVMARGITEEMVDDLSRVRGLRVEVSAQTPVEAVLETTFERTDGRVRLRLDVNRTDGRRHWFRTFVAPSTGL